MEWSAGSQILYILKGILILKHKVLESKSIERKYEWNYLIWLSLENDNFYIFHLPFSSNAIVPFLAQGQVHSYKIIAVTSR